ncbi:MAG TPA: hypothetical protein VN521_01880 [Negativicutes bacterium]|nr:hypothetical protein [Negativicutes bacterium]
MVAVQYRPFWFRLFDPRLTGGIIAIAFILTLLSFSNIFALGSLIGQQNTNLLFYHAIAAVVYGLAALGLLKVNRKARFLAIAITIISVLQGGISMLYINLLDGIVTVVIFGLVGIYLLSAKCRAVFYPPSEEEKDQG